MNAETKSKVEAIKAGRRLGELTRDERREVFRLVAEGLKPEFEGAPAAAGKPMTRAAALKEARRRWGRHAIIESRDYWLEVEKGPDGKALRPLRHVKVRRPYCMVGEVIGGFAVSVQGQGETWEQAFADADRKLGARP